MAFVDSTGTDFYLVATSVATTTKAACTTAIATAKRIKNLKTFGDIGGTNIRYQLVSFHAEDKLPLEVIKQQRMKVKNFETFEASITYFLEDIHGNQLPQVAVIAVAGPIDQNTVFLTNVPKWGLLNGT